MAIGLALVIACQVQEGGLVTSAPAQQPTSPGARRSPSIDPPAPSSPSQVDAAPAPPEVDAAPAPSEVAPGPPIDPPVRMSQDAAVDSVRAADAAGDCTSLPPGPFPVRVRDRGLVSDELTFDPQGRLLFIGGSDVVRWTEDLEQEVILRGVVGSQGGALRFLIDGSIVLADYEGDRVSRFSLTRRASVGSVSTRSPMKVAVGPAGRVYVSSDDGSIHLVDSNTGQQSVVASPDDSVGGLAFSADHQTLYVGLLDNEALAAFPVRAQGQLGPRTIVADDIPYPMGLAVDACGNLYSSGGPDGNVRRTTPDGRTAVVVRVDRARLWGLAFGSGQHGWSQTALYLTSDSEDEPGLFEAEIGVQGIPLAPPTGAAP